MPSQLAPPACLLHAQPANAAAKCCQLLQPGAGSGAAPDYLEACSQLPAFQTTGEAKVMEIFCSAVTHCQPECGAMDELLRALNGTGNFGQFIRSMRKAWQQQYS